MLAGDYLKEASDSNVDLCGVGLLYRFGYFTQSLSMDGQQIAKYDAQYFNALPIERELDANGKPTKWMVENSWGATSGHNGHLIMTDEWFDEYMFRLVVETKYASSKIQEILKQKPIRLPAWDPMFAGEE